jgi:nucleotide-binding universal stress UspA family protein
MNSGFLVWPPRACGRPGADGSELAGKAVQHCIALAKRIGAGVTVLTVLPPFHTFTTDAQMIEDTPDQYKVCMQKHASLVAVWRQKTGNSERSRPTASAARDEIADGDHSTF